MDIYRRFDQHYNYITLKMII